MGSAIAHLARSSCKQGCKLTCDPASSISRSLATNGESFRPAIPGSHSHNRSSCCRMIAKCDHPLKACRYTEKYAPFDVDTTPRIRPGYSDPTVVWTCFRINNRSPERKSPACTAGSDPQAPIRANSCFRNRNQWIAVFRVVRDLTRYSISRVRPRHPSGRHLEAPFRFGARYAL